MYIHYFQQNDSQDSVNVAVVTKDDDRDAAWQLVGRSLNGVEEKDILYELHEVKCGMTLYGLGGSVTSIGNEGMIAFEEAR